MNNKSVNQSIQELLKELQHLFGELKNDLKGTSQLELDLMKEKIRRIYDDLSDIEINKPVKEDKETEPISPPITEQTIEKQQEPKEVTELVLEIGDESQREVEMIDPEKKEEKEPSAPKPKHMLDLFEEPNNNVKNDDHKSIGEKIAENKSIESIGEAIQSKKILNLKLAIGINEKFFFLNELFEGKMNEYNKTIDQLDQKESFKDAMEYLVLLKEDKSWDEDAEAFTQLKGFLERKFN